MIWKNADEETLSAEGRTSIGALETSSGAGILSGEAFVLFAIMHT